MLETISISWSVICFIACLCIQLYYKNKNAGYRNLYENFFHREKNYATSETLINNERFTLLEQCAPEGSDLNKLIFEINHYVKKTRGTTDFSVIQNKVERMLSMRHDQATAFLAFPTYFGLMGTFVGVFSGIVFFVIGMNHEGGVTDDTIRNLLEGVMVSMTTSLFGLAFTTYNNHKASESDTKIEQDKNEFYDFVQTELMPNLDVSMVAAITRLHSTVDKFEPAFNRVISQFQQTFDRCTRAFGSAFEQNVRTVANAVDTMGRNMDKINRNIDLQDRLLTTLKSQSLVTGMEKYIEAAGHFQSITESLNKFEEARRMMLAAAQETILLQAKFNEELKVPREVAVRINQILDRIKEFETNVNNIGKSLGARDILGNQIIEELRVQVNAIRKKNNLAVKYAETADGKLEDFYNDQTKFISTLSKRYQEAIESHADNFDQMMQEQTAEMKKRHDEFMQAIEERLNIEDIRQEFTYLKKLDDIEKKLEALSSSSVKANELQSLLASLKVELDEIKKSNDAIAQKEVKEEKKGWWR